MNPLFPDEGKPETDKQGYLLSGGRHRIEPHKKDKQGSSPAVELIRRKIDTLYASEPKAKEEMRTAEQSDQRSKHQQFMHELSTSGKSLAQIQTEWHKYYAKLPDHEKHQVWQEFYQANQRHSPNFSRFVDQHAAEHHARASALTSPPHEEHAAAKAEAFVSEYIEPAAPAAGDKKRKINRERTVADIKKSVVRRVQSRAKTQLRAKKHTQSLLFGLSLGVISIFIFLFGFFNEVVIAPLIQPGGQASATPIILGNNGIAPTEAPEMIIPKINVQLPVVYGLSSSAEGTVQQGLEQGVIHYPSTAMPGQQGNAAFFGHSSNNIFNKGKYKFAFVLLRELVPGDIFYITYEGKVYSYRVFDKKVVEPSDTWVLGSVEGKVATAALITCDPPGTSRDRLVVWGEQISPDPAGNTATEGQSIPAEAEELPSEGPTAWTRFWRWITPW